MADFTISGVVTADTSAFVRSMNRVNTTLSKTDRQMQQLSRRIDELDGRKVDISVGIDNHTQRQLDELTAHIDELDGRNISMTIDIDRATRASMELEEVAALVAELDGKNVGIKIDIDGIPDSLAELVALDAELQNKKKDVDAADSAFRNFAGGGLPLMATGIAALVAAAAPLVPVVAGGLGAIASGATIAGTAVGAFGVFAVGAFKDIAKTEKELHQIQKKIDNASTPKALADALRQQKNLLDSIDPSMFKIIKRLDDFKTAYGNMVQALEPQIFGIFADGLDVATTALNIAFPIAKAMVPTIDGLVKAINQGLKSTDWQHFFDLVRTNGGPLIDTFARSMGNFLTGFINMMGAFLPMAGDFNGGLYDMSKRFKTWSEQLSTSKGFQDFANDVKTYTPIVLHFIGETIKFLWDFAHAVAPIGAQIIGMASSIFKWADSLSKAHPELAQLALGAVALVPLLGPLSTGFSAVEPILSKMLGPLGSLVGWFGGLAKRMAFAIPGVSGLVEAVGPLLAVLSGPVGIVALIIAGATALSLFTAKGDGTSKVFSTLQGIWSTLKSTAIDLWNNLKPLWNFFTSNIAPNFVEGFNSILQAVKPLVPILKPIGELLGVVIVGALFALGLAFRGVAAIIQWVSEKVIGPIVKAIVGAFQWLYNILVGHSIIPDLINSIRTWFNRIVNFIMDPVNSVKGLLVGAWDWLSRKLPAYAASAVIALKQKFDDAVTFFKNLPGKIVSAIGDAGKILLNVGKDIMHGLVDGIEAGVGWVKDKLSSVTNLIPSWKGPASVDAKLLFDNGQLIMGGLIDGIVSKQSELHSALKGITTSIADTAFSDIGGTFEAKGSASPAGGGTGAASIGVYVAAGGITVENNHPTDTGGSVTKELSRVARFGQFG